MIPHTLNYQYLNHSDRQFFIALQHLSGQDHSPQTQLSVNQYNPIFLAPLVIFLVVFGLMQIPWRQTRQRWLIANSTPHPLGLDRISMVPPTESTALSQYLTKKD